MEADLQSFIGFAPDLDPTTPGIILDCSMLLPSIRGMKAAASMVNPGMPALPEAALGGATVVRLDNTKRLIVGTQTNLYEEVSSAWNDVTRESGPYATPEGGHWRFTQFGNETVATNDADVLQESLSGRFGDIGAGVWLINVTDGGSGYLQPPNVTISGAGGTDATAQTFLNGDGVGSVTVTNAGSGFTGTATVEIDAPGETATGTATLSAGAVSAIAVGHGGSNYSTQPGVTISGGGGSGAKATAVLNEGVVTGFTVTAGGSGYTGVPDVTVDPPGRTATAVAVMQPAPVAAIVESVSGFVFACDTVDPNYGDRPNGWWCSGIFDQDIWTPSESTQCANGVLVDTPGNIRAARALGADMVLYKETSMYYGTYQGPPVIWAFPCISTQIGAPCQEAVVSIGTAHLFLGNDNFYIFDGTRPVPIGDQIKNWFFRNQNPKFTQTVVSVHDHNNSLVYWYYVSNASAGQIDSAVVYNYKVGRWGTANRPVECAVDFINGQIAWQDLGMLAPEWEDMPQVPWDSPFWTAAATQPSVIDSTHTLQTLTGVAGESSLTTGDFGDDEQMTLLQYIRLRAAQDPVSATMSTQHRQTLGGQFTVGATSSYQYGKFDVDVSARWHRALMQFQGDCEVIGFRPELVPDGLA